MVVLALWLAGLCAASQFAKIGVQLPEIGAIYPEAGTAIGWLFSLISLIGVLLGLVAGILGARIGARRLLLLSLVLGSGISLIQSSLPTFPVMLGFRIFEGFSHLGIVVAAPTLIGTLTPHGWRGAAMTLWSTFFGVAFALTAWLGTPLVAAKGPAILFELHAGAMLAMAVVLYVLLPHGSDPIPDGPPLSRILSPAALVERHLAAYRSPHISAPAWGWLFYAFTFISLVTILPQVVDPADRSFVAGIMPVASIGISVTLGIVLLKIFPATVVVRIGLFVAAIAACILIVAGVSPVLCITLIGSLGIVQGSSFAAIPQLNPHPEDQALANGALAQMGNLGNIAGTPVLFAVLAAGGVSAMIFVALACFVAAFAVHSYLALLRQRRPLSAGQG